MSPAEMYLHFTRQPPAELGSILSTHDWEESQFWTYKKARLNYDPVFGPAQQTWIRDHARTTGVSLKDARQIAINAQADADLHVEYLFEEVRLARFPDRPSRFKALYQFDESLDITTYANAMRIPLDRTLLKLEPIAATVCRVRLSTMKCVGRPDAEIAAQADKYWTEDPGPILDSELLLVGSYRFVEIVTRR